MQTASLELCRELYELSGWSGAVYVYAKSQVYDDVFWNVVPADIAKVEEWQPAYDLGYLLRKLPNRQLKLMPFAIERVDGNTTHWRCQYTTRGKMHMTVDTDKVLMGKKYEYNEIADTPEDAACKLAIELWKRGLLTKESA